jgi:hypothetical protein
VTYAIVPCLEIISVTRVTFDSNVTFPTISADEYQGYVFAGGGGSCCVQIAVTEG